MTIPAIRSRSSIAAELMTLVTALKPELTDFVDGSVVKSLLEAYATQVQHLEQDIYDTVLEGVEAGTYRNFNFTRLSAQPASGSVTITRPLAFVTATIPAGSQVSVPGDGTRIYETVEDVEMAIGVFSAMVTVRCPTLGAAGNTAALTITQIVTILGFPATVTNPAPFLNGKGEETTEARRQRFAEYLISLSKGTAAAIYSAVTSGAVTLLDAEGKVLERVVAAYVREPVLEGGRLGLVEVYIDNGGGTASPALVALAGDILRGYTDDTGSRHPGWVAAGIELRVFPVTAVVLNVTALITVAVGYAAIQVKAEVKAAIETYLLSLQVFQVAVLAEIIAAAMDIPGVADILISEPTANTIPAHTHRVISGTVTIL